MLLLLAVAGCSPPALVPGDAEVVPDDPTEDTPYVTPPTECGVGLMFVRGGMGEDAFAPVAEGDIVALQHGPTGGWRIHTALDVANSSGTVWILTTVTLLATGQVISGLQGDLDANNMIVQLVSTGECRGEMWGARAELNDFAPTEQYDSGRATIDDICAIYGQSARIAWTVTDLIDGRVAETSVEVVIAPDPFEYSECPPSGEDTGSP